jgi:hypothetical protein
MRGRDRVAFDSRQGKARSETPDLHAITAADVRRSPSPEYLVELGPSRTRRHQRRGVIKFWTDRSALTDLDDFVDYSDDTDSEDDGSYNDKLPQEWSWRSKQQGPPPIDPQLTSAETEEQQGSTIGERVRNSAVRTA